MGGVKMDNEIIMEEIFYKVKDIQYKVEDLSDMLDDMNILEKNEFIADQIRNISLALERLI